MDFTVLKEVIPQGMWMLLSFFFVAVIFGCIITAIIFFTKSSFDDFNNRRKITGIACLALAFVIGGIAVLTANDQNAKNNYNVAVSTENLKKKYSLSDVDWFATETTSRPDHSSSDGGLLVVDPTGQHIVFKYKVNMETGEPFLNNFPLKGGYAPGLTSESLEKK